MVLLKGAEVASALTENLAERAAALKARGVEPCLALLRVGERPEDLSYEAGATKRCSKIGIKVVHCNLPSDASTELILETVRKINEDRTVHGCLMFRPLENKEAEMKASNLLSPEKDVDAMTMTSLASVFLGAGKGYAPCTPQAVLEILDYYGIDVKGKTVGLVGRSAVVGRPLSMLLLNRNATVTMCHTKTVDLAEVCRKAEVLVVAAGHPGVITDEFVNENQVIIDVGINLNSEGKLCGDVDFASVNGKVKALTPVPGGVGAVTTSVLAKHVIEAAEKAL